MIVAQQIDGVTTFAYDFTGCGGRDETAGDDVKSISAHSADKLLRNAVTSSVHARQLDPSARRAVLPLSMEQRQPEESLRRPAFLDLRDNVDPQLGVVDPRAEDYPAPHRKGVDQLSNTTFGAALTSDIQAYPKMRTPIDIMRGNLLAAKMKRDNMHAKSEKPTYELTDFEDDCSVSESPAFGPFLGSVHQEDLLVNFKDRRTSTTSKPVGQKIHRKILSAFSTRDNPHRKKPAIYQVPHLNQKKDGKTRMRHMKTSHGSVKENETGPFVNADAPPKARPQHSSAQSTYPRRRVTPAAISLNDLQARLYARCGLHEELDQMVNAKSEDSHGDPLGVPSSPLDDDEDSEIQSDVSSAIEISNSSARSQKLLYYLRNHNNQSSHLTTRSKPEQIKDDSSQSSMLVDLECKHSNDDAKRIVLEGLANEAAEGIDDAVMTDSEVAEHDDRYNSNQRPTILGRIEAGKIRYGKGVQSTTSVGGFLASEGTQLHKSPREETNGLGSMRGGLEGAGAHGSMVKFDEDLLGARLDQEEDNEDWVSFGAFVVAPVERFLAPGFVGKEASSAQRTTPSPSDVPEGKSLAVDAATAPACAGRKVIIDVSGVETDMKESIIQIGSSDVSELTDFDFPDVSRASHPVDKETHEKLTTCDIIRLNRERLLAEHTKKKAKRQERSHTARASKESAGVAMGGPHEGLFQRPSSTPFQNKQQQQEGSISGPVMPPRSALKRSSFCGPNHQVDISRFTTTKGKMERSPAVAVCDGSFSTHMSKTKCSGNDEGLTMMETASMNQVGPRTVLSDDDEDDDDDEGDPLSRLRCLNRISI
jgi:hypothetical protein